MLELRIDGAAVNGATALFALNNPSRRQSQLTRHGNHHRRIYGESHSQFDGVASEIDLPFDSVKVTMMCGRYRLTAKERYLRDHFGLDEDPPWQPRWNIAPTQPIATVRQHPAKPRRIFGIMRWGLVPYWAKDQSFGLKTINAMSETAAEKPAFRDALKRRRCLIPADGFYEWKKTRPKEKQAYNFDLATGSVFAFAGLWDRWRDPNNNVLETCTILTTRPNSLVADVHDRMPAILDPADYERWLDPGIINPQMILDCLKPFDASLMRKYPVSPRVNRPENDDEECAREVHIIETAMTLF